MQNLGPVLTVDSVVIQYGGLVAVDDMSLEVSNSEAVGLVGPNGAGKTSLFEAICGLVVPRKGSIQLAGTELIGQPPSKINRLGVGRSFQMLELFYDMSVVENAMIGAVARGLRLQHARCLALDQLDLVGLAEKRDQPALTLSTGQRKRLELARALVPLPKVLLADEPFAGVDQHAAENLVKLLLEVRDELHVATLVIDHNLSLLSSYVDRMVVMDRGSKLADGSPDEVVEDPRVLKAYTG